MVNETERKCSHCGNNGHNSRTCNGKPVMLFGINIGTKSMKKSVSMGNLEPVNGSEEHQIGYSSDGPIPHRRLKSAHERKKGKPWMESEHMRFLAGLAELGKGDWRGIAHKFVNTRSPTQVASHAQKYFLRHSIADNRKRRSSLFDMPLNKQAASTSTSTSRPNVEPPSTQLPQVAYNNRALTPFPIGGGQNLPYMVGVSASNGSLLPVMNYPRPVYFYMPNNNGSSPHISSVVPTRNG